MKNQKAQLALRVALLSLTIFAIVAPAAFADTPGAKLGGSITSNVNSLIPAVLGCIGLFFLVTRDWFKMFSAFGITLLVAIFMNWTWVQGIATRLYTSFFA
ncbi:hypothetical protein GZH47_31660 (plasmid) [Paenibacillus rhizovicinus]|uniref:TrbC/VirB2 family protein n=1 Tax=Paenibacillus rhizovicinus TaxID=2704463 RepID=A0A6C0PAJ6_9BACL|nr:hypothetical protein [Paenibacillus rhizovicinus]QHW35456.1 hypothetical protein GZH47_31660 [Paenibacillus rhizovicinus]